LNSPLTSLKGVFASFRNNPDYAGSIVVGYGVTGLQILVQLFLVPFYIASFGKFGFGALMVLLACANVARLGLVWLAGPMLRLLGEAYAEADRRAYARRANAFRMVYISYGVATAVVLCAVGIVTPGSLFGPGAEIRVTSLHSLIVLVSVYTGCLCWLTAEVVVLAARKRQTLGQFSQFMSLLVFVALALPVLLLGGDLANIAACFVAGAVVSILFCLYFSYRDDWGFPSKGGLPFYSEIVAYIRPQAGGYAIYGGLLVLLQSDTLIVGIIGGAGAAAEFVLVWKIAEVIIMLIWRFCESLQPEIINMDMTADRERIARLYSRAIRLLLMVSLFAGTAYALSGHYLVRGWVGAAAPDSRIAYVCAGGAIFWMAIARLPSVMAYSLGRLTQFNRILGLEVILRVVLTLSLYGTVSFIAPILAINIVHAFGLALVYVLYGRHLVRGSG